jgi:hypothetical protein
MKKQKLTFAQGRFLPRTEIIASIEETKSVISPHTSSDGFYYQIQNKNTRSSETNIILKLRPASLFSKREYSAARKAIEKELKLVPYRPQQRLTGRLKEVKGLYIVDPNFMRDEIINDPNLRIQNYIHGLNYGWEKMNMNRTQNRSTINDHRIPNDGC